MLIQLSRLGFNKVFLRQPLSTHPPPTGESAVRHRLQRSGYRMGDTCLRRSLRKTVHRSGRAAGGPLRGHTLRPKEYRPLVPSAPPIQNATVSV
jgi:hypothetical protein